MSETRAQLQEAEHRIAIAEQRADIAERSATLAEERAEQAKHAAERSQKRAELAEETGAELEKKLEDLEELLQYRELVQATQAVSIGPQSTRMSEQGLCDSQRLLRHSCNSLGSYFITHNLPDKVLPDSGQSQCGGDELSITSL